MLEIWRKYARNAGLDLMYRDEREFYDFTREQEAAGGWGEGSRGAALTSPARVTSLLLTYGIYIE